MRDLLLRIHARVTLRTVDRVTALLGGALGIAAAREVLTGPFVEALIAVSLSVLALAVVVACRHHDRASVWRLAEAAGDPIAVLAAYQALYDMPLGQVRAVLDRVDHECSCPAPEGWPVAVRRVLGEPDLDAAR